MLYRKVRILLFYQLHYFRVNLEDLVFDHVKIKSTHNGTTPVNGELFRFPINRQTCLAIYAILNVTIVGIVLVRCATLVSLFVTVSINLHKKMFNTITTATMYFFNINSSGIECLKL